jgi:hypothetical protein
MNNVAKAFKTVRDVTFCNQDITMGESLAILDCVKAEITASFLEQIKPELDFTE